jgi:hypothetical protein
MAIDIRRREPIAMRGTRVANLEDARRLLGHGALFRNLAPNERESLVAGARMRRFNAGDTIFLMGELQDSMFAVVDGEVRISILSVEGKEFVLAILQAGEVFGEIAMLDGKPRSADATALTACNLAVWKSAMSWPRLIAIRMPGLGSSRSYALGCATRTSKWSSCCLRYPNGSPRSFFARLMSPTLGTQIVPIYAFHRMTSPILWGLHARALTSASGTGSARTSFGCRAV